MKPQRLATQVVKSNGSSAGRAEVFALREGRPAGSGNLLKETNLRVRHRGIASPTRLVAPRFRGQGSGAPGLFGSRRDQSLRGASLRHGSSAWNLRAAGAFSSGGESARLITVRSVVRVHKGPRPDQATAGDVAQLEEHLLCKQGVGSSSLPISTAGAPVASTFTDPNPPRRCGGGPEPSHMNMQVCE